jgi:hypothetical protein
MVVIGGRNFQGPLASVEIFRHAHQKFVDGYLCIKFNLLKLINRIKFYFIFRHAHQKFVEGNLLNLMRYAIFKSLLINVRTYIYLVCRMTFWCF